MQTQLSATRTRINEIIAIREAAHDYNTLAAEYRMLADREAFLLRALLRAL